MVWMFKIVWDRSKFVVYLNKFFKVGVAVEWLGIFSIIFMILVHICTCFWVLISKIIDTPQTWIYANDYQDASNGDLYIASFYFVIATIATVGFGDIAP